MAEINIAVIGAGPKAAAIAAKADVLNRINKSHFKVTIFESVAPGANWAGKNGYTDGLARLCTPAERDLGFPYDAGVFDQKVAAMMYSDYSWGAYLIANGHRDDRLRLHNWINRGRLPPTHNEYSSYIGWAISKSGAKLEIGEVTKLESSSNMWRVHRRGENGGMRTQGMFDGVVVTGPGSPNKRLIIDGVSGKITDGRAFWQDPESFLAQVADSNESVIILGAGGTAAAIAARALRAANSNPITIIGDQAALFTRADAFFENQIFTDDQIWDRLDAETRKSFADRLNRGVVWSTISDELARSPRVRFEPGRGKKIEVLTGENGDELRVLYERSSQTFSAYASLVIDASGFDPWWFVSLLPATLQAQLCALDDTEQKGKRTAAAARMTKHLELFDAKPGPIHAPVLSQSIGPGYSSLMVLGAMSDLILDRYNHPKST